MVFLPFLIVVVIVVAVAVDRLSQPRQVTLTLTRDYGAQVVGTIVIPLDGR